MPSKSSLIIGGSGQLGKYVVDVFKNKGWKVLSLDIKENNKADSNFILNSETKI